MDHFFSGHEAITRVGEHRIGIDRLIFDQGNHSRSATIGHVSGFRHRGRGQEGIAERMDVLDHLR